MTKIFLLLVLSMLALSLSGCSNESWGSIEGRSNPAVYIPEPSTESHMYGPAGPNTAPPGFSPY
jgi:hypothetical protein